MPFKKGKSGNPTGRPLGATGKITRSVKEVVLHTFIELQNHPTANLKSWAEENTTEFYKVASKLIPTELNANIEKVTIKVERD